jgi:hypothetical protein
MSTHNVIALFKRVSHRHFDIDDVASLRSLVGLLRPYLKAHWQVVDGEDADLVLVRVDDPQRTAELLQPLGARAVPCVRRPRDMKRPAIHRPLRAYELLSTLNEASANADQAAGRAQGEVALSLAYWPLEFDTWPADYTRVLAALAGEPRLPGELALLTGTSEDTVTACLETLQRANALKRSPREAQAGEGARPAGLLDFISRVGRRLGFGGRR